MNSFTIEMQLPGLNEYTQANRTHAQAGGRFKKQTEADIMLFICLAKRRGELRPVDYPVTLKIEWQEATRKRDPDNIVSAKKFILDALVSGGILPNDTQRYIKGFTERIIKSDAARVKVTLIPADDQQETARK